MSNQTVTSEDPGSSPVESSGRSMLANIASLATSQVITWSLTLLWIVVVPRLLGPDQMGLLVIATSVTAVVAVVLSIPPKDFLVREMVSRGASAPRVLLAAFTTRLAVVPLVFLTGGVYGHAVGLDGTAMKVMYLMAGATACTMLLEPTLSAFQARERMQFIAYTDVSNKSLQTVGGVVLALAGFGVVAIAGFSLAVGLLVLIMALIWVHRMMGLRARRDRLAPMLKRGFPYWFVSVFFVVYLWTDALILGAISPPEVVGWYGAATRLFTTMMFLAAIVAMASLPRLIKAHAEGEDRFFATARPPFEWVVILGLAIGVGLAMVSEDVVPLLYGGDYAGAVPALVLLGLCLPFMYMNTLLNQLFVASGRPMSMAGVLSAAAVVNVALNLVLIPMTQERFDNGAIGAGTALILTEMIQLVCLILVIGRQFLARSVLTRILKAATAAAVMAWTLWWMNDVPLPLQIMVGASTFVLVAFLLRLPTGAERRLMREKRLVLVNAVRSRIQNGG